MQAGEESRNRQKPLGAIRSRQVPSGAIRCHQVPSGAARKVLPWKEEARPASRKGRQTLTGPVSRPSAYSVIIGQKAITIHIGNLAIVGWAGKEGRIW